MTVRQDPTRIPNLFIVGAPKCGTTAWMEYLKSHPDIFFPDTKEECFFALDLPKFRFVHSEEEYAKLFEGRRGERVVGEASAMYLFSSTAAAAIAKYNPNAKILIFLRDQEDFLPSLHNQFLREFSEEIDDFETAWRLSPNRPPETIPKACLEPRTLDYAAMGRFDEQVARYLAAFPAEQVRVIRFRDWVANPRATYLEVLDFLGVPDDGRTDFPRVNPGITYRSRSLVRMLLFPPKFAREAVHTIRRLTGFPGQRIWPLVKSVVDLLAVTGYDKRIRRKLRDEIRRYYADDNQRLEARLATAAEPETIPIRIASTR